MENQALPTRHANPPPSRSPPQPIPPRILWKGPRRRTPAVRLTRECFFSPITRNQFFSLGGTGVGDPTSTPRCPFGSGRLAPSQHHSSVGQEHGRTMPLAAVL